MKADEHILGLPYRALGSRELLPELAGIYYVLDEKLIIWYIGQAKNLRTRWAGESHHRLYQLQKQRKNQFVIYYELVAESQLNVMEQQRIEQYNPLLNRTRVKTQKLQPTETLLRETLVILAPYSFVLGVEPPRKQDRHFIEDSVDWRDKWKFQKKILPLNVIHICINLQALQETFKDWLSVYRFLSKVFKKRSRYADNWVYKGKKSDEKSGVFYAKRLLFNGFAIEVYAVLQGAVEHIQDYELTQLAGVEIRAVNEVSLAVIRDKWLLTIGGMYIFHEHQNTPNNESNRREMERLSPYKQDLVKLLFNEELDTSKLQIFPTERKITEENNTSFPVRLANLATKKEYLRSLLTERGIDLNCYQVNKYLESIPKDENYTDSNYDRRMTVYVKSFIYSDLRKPGYYTSVVQGIKGNKYQSSNLLDFPYKEVYLTATVDRAFWLLLETYLLDFAKVKLKEEQGFVKRHYFSPRKFLVPAMLTVTLNGKWRGVIPFGPTDGMSYNEVTEIIKSRLQKSGIPKLKFLFKHEYTRT